MQSIKQFFVEHFKVMARGGKGGTNVFADDALKTIRDHNIAMNSVNKSEKSESVSDVSDLGDGVVEVNKPEKIQMID